MKLINKAIYALSVAGMMGLWSCSSEEAMPDVNVASGERVPITIVVSREGDSGTRTELSENLQNGGLTHTWSAGDELYLYNSNGADAGKVTLESGEGSAKGVFKGEVTATSGEYCLWYFGSKQSTAADADLAGYPYVTVSGGQVTLDLKAPKFETAADFSKVDVMSQKATINVNGNQATVAQTVTMQPHVALARFDLRNLPAGVTGTLKVYDTKAQTEGFINTKQVLSLSDGSVVRSEETEAYTFTDWSSDKDLYVAFVPYSSNLKFEYTYQKEVQEVVNGATVKNTYPIKNIHSFKENQNLVAGIYYQSVKTVEGSQAPTIGGVEVPFEIDDSDNPGNMGKWGENNVNIPPKGIPFGPEFASVLEGWTLNSGNSWDTYGGYCRAIEYTNGLYNSLLTSKGNTCFYYQWGRYLGFPSNTATGTTYILNNNILPLSVGYRDDVGGGIGYLARYMGNDSKDNLQKSLDWAIVFGQTNNDYLDYIYNNAYNDKWTSRSVDPCPSGYRLPTYSELSVFIPSTLEVNGTCTDVKSVNGLKYAFKWTVGSQNNIYYIDVTSVLTTENKITADYVGFNTKQAKTKRIWAYGYLMDNGKQSSWGSTAAYWSSDSGTNNALSGVYGKGGRALYIEFSRNKASFAELNIPFGFGLPIMAIKDSNAVESSIKPWLPYGGNDYTKLPGYK